MSLVLNFPISGGLELPGKLDYYSSHDSNDYTSVEYAISSVSWSWQRDSLEISTAIKPWIIMNEHSTGWKLNTTQVTEGEIITQVEKLLFRYNWMCGRSFCAFWEKKVMMRIWSVRVSVRCLTSNPFVARFTRILSDVHCFLPQWQKPLLFCLSAGFPASLSWKIFRILALWDDIIPWECGGFRGHRQGLRQRYPTRPVWYKSFLNYPVNDREIDIAAAYNKDNPFPTNLSLFLNNAARATAPAPSTTIFFLSRKRRIARAMEASSTSRMSSTLLW